MCTVSWWRRNGCLSLRFNRDEATDRLKAEPPRQKNTLIYPRDPVGGGTWICVDPKGTVHCLLNYYDADEPKRPESPRTRGELPLQSAQTPLPFHDWLDPEPYPPFHLLRIPRIDPIHHVSWNGQQLFDGPSHNDITHWTTSGWNSAEVVEHREHLFNELLQKQGLSEQTLHDFHYASHPEKSGFWPLMYRKDAQTVSISEIKSDEHQIHFRYCPVQNRKILQSHECTQSLNV